MNGVTINNNLVARLPPKNDKFSISVPLIFAPSLGDISRISEPIYIDLKANRDRNHQTANHNMHPNIGKQLFGLYFFF